MRRWPAVAASTAVVMGGWTADWSNPLGATLDVIAGGAFLTVGVVASTRSSRYAALASLAGVAWFAGNVVDQALWLHRPLMLHTALAYPSGRVRSRPDTALIVVGWLAGGRSRPGRLAVANALCRARGSGWCGARGRPRAAARPRNRHGDRTHRRGHSCNPGLLAAGNRSRGLAVRDVGARSDRSAGGQPSPERRARAAK